MRLNRLPYGALPTEEAICVCLVVEASCGLYELVRGRKPLYICLGLALGGCDAVIAERDRNLGQRQIRKEQIPNNYGDNPDSELLSGCGIG